MGFRFRKSIVMGPFRVNVSKSGLGWSVGAPGARYTRLANGRTRITTSIPGTGVSWVEESKNEPETTNIEQKDENLTGWPLFWSIMWGIVKALFWTAVICLVLFTFIVLPILAAGTKGK